MESIEDKKEQNQIINAIVIYWSQSKHKHYLSEKSIKSKEIIFKFYCYLLHNLNENLRDLLINAILNSLRFPCVQTMAYSLLIQELFFEIKNDVKIYLLEPCEDIEDEDFDILNWWRVNGSKYRVLSKLARDIFAIQVSTVASESAFSTGGRILDPFRSSLTPKMVETLVCTQNWLKASPNMDRFYMENVEYYENLDTGNTIIYMQL